MQSVSAIDISAHESDVFAWDIPDAVRVISDEMPSLVFLCNPNNPTGRYLSEVEVRHIAEALPNDSLLLLDEAYLPFVEVPWNSLPLLDLGNVALLRSMTKDYALTALRLGYMLAPPNVVDRIGGQQYSWSVNALAQAAGLAALADSRHVDEARKAVHVAKDYLVDQLEALGLETTQSAANFVLVNVVDARALRQKLLRHHQISVRDCTSFGLPEYIRIGIRTLRDCERLVAALRETLEKS